MKMSLISSILVFLVITALSSDHIAKANASRHIGKGKPLHLSGVVDTDGDELQEGVEYYVNSWCWGACGGVVELGSKSPNGSRCPLAATYPNPLGIPRGTPVTFSSVGRNSVTIKFSTEAESQVEGQCPNDSLMLMVNEPDESTGLAYVTTGGVEVADPTCETSKSWFYIRKSTALPGITTYNIVHCPEACLVCSRFIGIPLGFYVDSDRSQRYIVHGGSPLDVIFVKASGLKSA